MMTTTMKNACSSSLSSSPSFPFSSAFSSPFFPSSLLVSSSSPRPSFYSTIKTLSLSSLENSCKLRSNRSRFATRRSFAGGWTSFTEFGF
jgi:hypothetical protein